MPTPGTIAIIILVILILAVIVSCIQIVQQSKAYVIERLGAFHSVWGVGMHFKLPFIERVVKKVSLKEQVADFDPQPVITKDNVTMQIDTVIYFQITDPKLYTYREGISSHCRFYCRVRCPFDGIGRTYVSGGTQYHAHQ